MKVDQRRGNYKQTWAFSIMIWWQPAPGLLFHSSLFRFFFFFFFFFLLPARLFRAILHYLSLFCRLAPLRNCNTPGFILMIQYKDFPLRNKIVSVLWNNLPHRGHFKLALPEFDATVTERVHCRPVIRYNYFFLIEDRGREKNSTVL